MRSMSRMKLFLLSQSESNGYDTYDGVVVCAPNEDAARRISPCYNGEFGPEWCSSPDKVTVQLIGDAEPGLPAGVVCSSFYAG